MKLLRRINERKGFTFVEMMMVIAILAVILAFAVPGFASYSKRIKLMELDDSARTIFMAAQNRLMSLHTSGADIDFAGSQSVKIDEVPDCFTKVKDEHGNEKEYYDYTAEGYYQPDFRYITSKKIKEIADKDHSIIVELSSGGTTSIEDQLYQNYFIIEYDASTGFVLGVFYTEEEDLLYKEADGKTLGAAYPSTLSAKRDFEERLKAGGTVGYYGGGTLVNIPKGAEVAQPVANKGNLEKLVFTVEYPATGTEDKYYISFTIWEADESYHKKESTKVEIIPKDENYYVTKGGAATIILDSLAPGMGSDKGQWNPPTDTKDMTGYVLERDFKGWVYRDPLTGNPVSDNTMWANNSYPNKMDNYYLINPGANIIVEIDFYDPTGIKDEYTLIYGDNSDDQVNSYFARLDGNRASITAGRHLQNLANYVDGNLVQYADLNDTIDFSLDKTGTADCYSAWNSAETYKGNDSYESTDEKMKIRAKNLYDFKPVGSQFVGESKFLLGFNGHYSDKGNMIKYLRINTDPDVHPEYENTEIDVYNFTGFMAMMYNSSGTDNFCFYCPVVKGNGEFTGTFIGADYGGSHYTNIVIINPIVEGPGYVGGFGGGKSGGGDFEGDTVKVEEVDNYFNNYADDYKERKYTGESITWKYPDKDPYERFAIKGLSADNYKAGPIAEKFRVHIQDLIYSEKIAYAGGMTGCQSGIIKQANVAIRVESTGYAGGLCGYGYNSDIQDNQVGGHTYEGTFIGTFKDESGADKEYCLINIKGVLGAGGIAGKTNKNEVTKCYTTCSVGYISDEKSDTFMGECPAGFSGQHPAYALGYLIDESSKTIKSFRSNKERVLDRIGAANEGVFNHDAITYDETLDKFPYTRKPAESGTHTGDWPVDPPVMGMFYWESVGGEYGILGKFYNAKTGESGKIDTLTGKEDAEVTEYGYGYFYTPAVTTASKEMLDNIINNTDYAVDKSVRDEIEKDTQVMPIIIMRKVENAKVHDLVSLSFDYSYKDASGEKTFRFNPDFCGVSELETLGTDGNRYRIRSAAQFSNIKNSRGAAFEQDLSINLGNHYAIGSLKKGAFTGMYNGKGKTIEVHNLFFEAGSDIADGNGIGIFGVTRGAKIEKIEANYSSSNIYDISGESSSRIGVGGIAGIAIGGSIENCKVYNFNVSVTNRYNTAIGGIVGYSSADISNCELCGGKKPGDADNSAISIDNQTGGSAGDVAAAGGIAGSASGTITKCKVNTCSMGDMKAAKIEAESNAPLVIAGGIVGNNVSFEGKTDLQVEDCESHSYLTRPGRVESVDKSFHNWLFNLPDEVTRYDYNVLIHPIAPDTFVLNTNDTELYELTSGKDSSWIKDFLKWFLELIGIIDSDKEEQPEEYTFLTGTGVESVPADGSMPILNVTYKGTNTAYQGERYYNSRICGKSVGSGVEIVNQTEPTRKTSDVYVFSPQNPIYTTYTKLAPTAGIYSLYEKDGTSIFAKEYLDNPTLINKESEQPDDHSDPLYRYGVLVTLGRFDEEEVVITIDKGEPIKAIGQSYTDQSGNAITLSTSDSGNASAKYFDFSEEIISEPGPHTVTVEYKDKDAGSTETVLSTTIDIPERYPYVGVYQLKNLDNSTRLDGVFTTESEVKEVKTENGTEIGEYGIMLEHSDVAPHTLSEIEVTLSYKVDEKVVEKVLKPSELVNAGKDAYSGENWVKPQVHGKYFDFYNISKSVLEEIPEYTEITITVRYKDGEKTGKELASADYKTPLQIPHFGVYGLEKLYYKEVYGGDQQYDAVKYIFKFADDSDDKATAKTEITFFASNLVKREIEGYGILLEKGYDINKVTVKLSGGKKEATIDGKDLEPVKKDYYKGVYKDASDPNLAPFQNDGHLSDNVAYDLYKIDLEDVPESTAKIELIYTGAETYTMLVDITGDLKAKVKGHNHKPSENWESDENEHWKECLVEDCPDAKDGENKILKAAHTFEWVETKKATETEAGIKDYKCTVCGHVNKTVEIPPHKHVYPDEWTPDPNDNTQHYRECIATVKDFKNDEWVEEVCGSPQYESHTPKLVTGGTDQNWHHYICETCKHTWSEAHKWQDDPENDKQEKCSVCGEIRQKTLPDAGDITKLGVYVKSPSAWGSGNDNISAKGYFKDGQEADFGGYQSGKENGIAGILISEEFIDDITVYVDNEPVNRNQLINDTVGDNLLTHYGNPKLSAYKISPDVIQKKEVIDIEIRQNSTGGGLLFKKTNWRIRAHEHNYVWRQALDGEDQSMHYGTCDSPYCTDNDLLVKPHTKGNQKIVVEATEENPTGTISYTCEECGYTWTEEYHYSAKPVIGIIGIYDMWNGSEVVSYANGTSYGVPIGSPVSNSGANISKVGLLIGDGVDLSKITVYLNSNNDIIGLNIGELPTIMNAYDFEYYRYVEIYLPDGKQLYYNANIQIIYDGEEVYNGQPAI